MLTCSVLSSILMGPCPAEYYPDRSHPISVETHPYPFPALHSLLIISFWSRILHT